MKAIVNLGLRTVELIYTIKLKNMVNFNHNEVNENFKNWELTYNDNCTKAVCKHTLSFKDCDEWQSTLIFDGRMIDFHYDYEERKEFKSKKEWGEYLFQGYEYIEGKPQLYDNNIIKTVIVEF